MSKGSLNLELLLSSCGMIDDKYSYIGQHKLMVHTVQPAASYHYTRFTTEVAVKCVFLGTRAVQLNTGMVVPQVWYGTGTGTILSSPAAAAAPVWY